MGSTTRGLVRGFCAAQLRARFAVGAAVGGPGGRWRGGREKSFVECCRQKCYVAEEGLSWPAVQTGPGKGMGCTSWYEMGDVVRASRFVLFGLESCWPGCVGCGYLFAWAFPYEFTLFHRSFEKSNL